MGNQISQGTENKNQSKKVGNQSDLKTQDLNQERNQKQTSKIQNKINQKQTKGQTSKMKQQKQKNKQKNNNDKVYPGNNKLEQPQKIKKEQYIQKSKTASTTSQLNTIKKIQHKHSKQLIAYSTSTGDQYIQQPKTFIWISNKFNKKNYPDQDFGQRGFVETEVGFRLYPYQNVDSAKFIVDQKFDIIVICNLSNAQSVQQAFGKKKNVKEIICYCMDINVYKKLKGESKLGNKFKQGFKDQSQLINYLKKKKNKQLPQIDKHSKLKNIQI